MRDGSKENRGGIVHVLVRSLRVSEFAICALVLLGLSAALVPQLTRASSDPGSRPDAVVGVLQYVRTQIRVYCDQHGGRPPGIEAGNPGRAGAPATFIAQMTGYTDAQGAVGASRSDMYRFGPYLAGMPANPATGRSGLLIVPGPVFPAADDTQPYGWMYCPQTRQFVMNAEGAGPDGVPYTNY